MSDQPDTTPAAVRLEELLALNDEIGTLIRAGVPLELGLRQYGEANLPGIPSEYKRWRPDVSISAGLERLSNRLADRIATGLSLQEAIDAEGDHLPGVYRAVVEAGVRAGRLPEALEALAVVARSLLKLHRQILAAMIYPAIVLGIVWLALIALVIFIVPVFLSTWDSLGFVPGPAINVLIFVQETLPYWGLGVPVLAWILFLLLSASGGRSDSIPGGRLVEKRLHRFAWIPGVVGNYDYATFLQMLSLLIEHEAPLHESLVLAAHSTGNRHIIIDSTRIAERLAAGESLSVSLSAASRLPKFLRWMLRAGVENGKLNETLKLAADVYQKRASRRAELLKVVLPVVLTVVVAGGVTLLYGIILFAPIRELYQQLASPTL